MFVRNPWERLVSLYEHSKREQVDIAPFSQWLSSTEGGAIATDGEHLPPWRRYGAWSIAHYIRGNSQQSLVDRVIRLEDIRVDLVRVLKAQGVPLADNKGPGWRNQHSGTASYRDYYDEISRSFVEEHYRYDIEHYGYRFDESD